MKRPFKLLIPAILSVTLFVGSTYSAEKPVVKDKKAAEKNIQVKKASERTDYLKHITPKAINDVTSGEMTYQKDANGVYQLVPKKGC